MESYLPYVVIITKYQNVFLASLLILVILYVIYLHHKIRIFTRGQNGKSLESILEQCVLGIAEIEKRNEVISEHALTLHKRLLTATRNIEMVRYKAFDTNGSNQSFSVAFINEEGNGVVISSLHTHDRVSTFAKPIEHYVSSYELTDEERDVIERAKKGHNQTK